MPAKKQVKKGDAKVTKKAKRSIKGPAREGVVKRSEIKEVVAAQAAPAPVVEGSACDCINFSEHGGGPCPEKVVSPAVLCAGCQGHKL